jgi:hypothetical protein
MFKKWWKFSHSGVYYIMQYSNITAIAKKLAQNPESPETELQKL